MHELNTVPLPSDAPPLADVLVLAVDDVPENLEVLTAVLKRPGVHLLKALGGTEALELLLQHDVALALVDVQMPGMSGFELAELMRGAERSRHVPIIFLTAGAPEEMRVFRGYEAGAVDFLFKPFEPRLLQSKVDVFIELFRQRQRLAAQVEEHRQLVRMAELLIGVLSHDLRSPLHTIVTVSETLRLAAGDDGRLQKLASTVRGSADRMGRLITQLLDFATARLGTLPVRPQAVDVSELCETAMSEFVARGTHFEHEVRGCSSGTWDPDRLLQVLSNLLGNAVQHGEPGATIRLLVDGTHDDLVVLEVANPGVLPEAVQRSLFLPFGRSSEASAGTGLGLYIVDQVVQAHGGRVTAENRAGHVVVRIRLPRHVSASAEGGERSGP